MNVDDIKYGNLRKSHFDAINEDKDGMLSKALEAGIITDIFENYSFPPNSSKKTKGELEYLKGITDSATEEDKKFCNIMEDHHYKFFEKVAKDLGMENITEDTIEGWCEVVDPIIFYLKHKFNRPRPHQLAYALGIDLYPIIATDANSGAYPSGHTMDFLIILFQEFCVFLGVGFQKHYYLEIYSFFQVTLTSHVRYRLYLIVGMVHFS